MNHFSLEETFYRLNTSLVCYSTKHCLFHFQLKWGAGYEGQGEMFYDYNHVPKYEEPEPAYAPPAYSPPAYAPPAPAYAPKPSYTR